MIPRLRKSGAGKDPISEGSVRSLLALAPSMSLGSWRLVERENCCIDILRLG